MATEKTFTLDFFKKKGRKGGKIGGKRSLETMTPEQRSERARNAVKARKWHAVKPADANGEAAPAAKKRAPAARKKQTG